MKVDLIFKVDKATDRILAVYKVSSAADTPKDTKEWEYQRSYDYTEQQADLVIRNYPQATRMK